MCAITGLVAKILFVFALLWRDQKLLEQIQFICVVSYVAYCYLVGLFYKLSVTVQLIFGQRIADNSIFYYFICLKSHSIPKNWLRLLTAAKLFISERLHRCHFLNLWRTLKKLWVLKKASLLLARVDGSQEFRRRL